MQAKMLDRNNSNIRVQEIDGIDAVGTIHMQDMTSPSVGPLFDNEGASTLKPYQPNVRNMESSSVAD